MKNINIKMLKIIDEVKLKSDIQKIINPYTLNHFIAIKFIELDKTDSNEEIYKLTSKAISLKIIIPTYIE